jgi:hypothetical protein
MAAGVADAAARPLGRVCSAIVKETAPSAGLASSLLHWLNTTASSTIIKSFFIRLLFL